MAHTYMVFCSSFDPLDGFYTRNDGVIITSDDPDLDAWLAAGNTPTAPAGRLPPLHDGATASHDARPRRAAGGRVTARGAAMLSDRERMASHARKEVVMASDPVLVRIAALAVPPIDLGTVFTQAASD